MRPRRPELRRCRERDGDGRKCAGRVELECVEWGDQLQREALDDERRSVHDHRESGNAGLHEHRVTNGTTYFYVVSALNGSVESNNSTEVNATPQATAPPVPRKVTATGGNAQVVLGWSASSG